MIIYRHVHILSMARYVASPPSDEEMDTIGITKYHMVASMDDFNTLHMHMSIPIAARLNYRHDFSGFYNHISQVVFFHNSEYMRIPRAPLSEMRQHGPEHSLPALFQLYPQIKVKYEDEKLDLTPDGGSDNDWFWLIVPRRVYLVDPERRVYFNKDPCILLTRIFLPRFSMKKKIQQLHPTSLKTVIAL
jgi:hypothetical protein